MIDAIKTLLNKTNELENEINNFKNEESNVQVSNNFACFSKGLINLSFLNSNKLLIAEFETKQNIPLYFQNQIELNIPSDQEVKISLIINNIAIYRSTRKLQAGYNQFTIMKGYIPLKSEQVEIYLKITSEEDSPMTLISNTLLVWGINNINNQVQYQAIETKNNFLLSYLNNNTLYYSSQNKNEIELNSEDFTYYANSISHSFAYLQTQDLLFLFRVDLDGNLFFTNFSNINELFLESGISHVSSCSNNDLIAISIIKNGKVYVAEFYQNGTISKFQEVDCQNIYVVKTYLYFNKYDNCFYMILTDKNNANYLIKNLKNFITENHFINAKYSITYSTYEVQ